jgi:hypothetical protein
MQYAPSAYAVLPIVCWLAAARRRSDLAEGERAASRGRLLRHGASTAVPIVVRCSLTPEAVTPVRSAAATGSLRRWSGVVRSVRQEQQLMRLSETMRGSAGGALGWCTAARRPALLGS